VIYQKGLLNSQLAALAKSSDAKKCSYICWLAEPKSIAELKYYGLSVPTSYKG
jgi:hypothetical protein